MYTKFGAGVLVDIIGLAFSDKEKKKEEAKKIISNEEIIDFYSEEIKRILLASGKFKSVNILAADRKYIGNDENNDPISKWFGNKDFFNGEYIKGEYLENPNFRNGQEILIEYGIDQLFFKEYSSGEIYIDPSDLLIKIIDKESGKLIARNYCYTKIDPFDIRTKTPISQISKECISKAFNAL
jgi:hypothetical protein